MAHAWLLCSYRLPRTPTRLRLAAWRRARRLGAVLLHDAVWVLPADAKTREDFEWLAEEIEERGGSVLLWEASSLGPGQDRTLVERFRADANGRYADIAVAADQLARLARRRRLGQPTLDQGLQRLRLLERSLRLERRRDYFRAPGREAAASAVATALTAFKERTGGTITRGRARAVGD
ncbi:MAG TPA: Chromate resistance protein ChrB [Gemmatimonadales bacterium]|nr:Chromate resistance protein ChrB [Gemmatimonadales bacterium]